MRIIAGMAKGRSLQAPTGMDTRPTLDRIKESLFNILQFAIPDARVLDLFAGTGNLALEALSRGAAFAVLNDSSCVCCECIRENIQRLGFEERTRVTQMDAMQYLSYAVDKPFDIAFLDPPYRMDVRPPLEMLFSHDLLSPHGIVVVEHDWALPPVEQDIRFKLKDRRKYGGTGLSFFERTVACT